MSGYASASVSVKGVGSSSLSYPRAGAPAHITVRLRDSLVYAEMEFASSRLRSEIDSASLTMSIPVAQELIAALTTLIGHAEAAASTPAAEAA